MSGKQKFFLVLVLVLIVGLFAIAVASGGGRGKASDRNGFVDWLGSLAGGSAAVTVAEVTADCAEEGGRLVVSGQCVLRVRPSSEGLRMLTLRSPKAFTVSAPAPGDADFTMSDEVKPEDGRPAQVSVAVDKAVEVVVGCPAPAQCVITLVEGEE